MQDFPYCEWYEEPVEIFTLTDKYDWPLSCIKEEALNAAKRRGEQLGFRADKVDVLLVSEIPKEQAYERAYKVTVWGVDYD